MRNREIARFLLFGLAACLPFFLLFLPLISFFMYISTL